MTALWIILGVLALIIAIIVVLLHFSIKAHIEGSLKTLSLSVKYLGIKLYGLELPNKGEPEEPETEPAEEIKLQEITQTDEILPEETKDEPESEKPPEAEPEPPEEKEESKPEEEEKTEPKPSLIDQFNEYKKYIPAGKKAFKKLLKLIRFKNLRVELLVGNEDPYKAGVAFGRINSIFYSVLGLFCCIFSVTLDKTSIKCDFEKKTTELSFGTDIYVRPSAVVALAAYVGIYYLKVRKSMKKLEISAKEKSENERKEHQS